jgi:DNA-binding NarL/FixJ family response regulator
MRSSWQTTRENFGDGCGQMLDGSHEFNVVGEAGSGREVLELADHLMPDLVISDVDMADSDGLEFAREVVERSPDIKVILVSGHDGRSYARLAQQEGALAFIPKAKVSLEAVRQAMIRTG